MASAPVTKVIAKARIELASIMMRLSRLGSFVGEGLIHKLSDRLCLMRQANEIGFGTLYWACPCRKMKPDKPHAIARHATKKARYNGLCSPSADKGSLLISDYLECCAEVERLLRSKSRSSGKDT